MKLAVARYDQLQYMQQPMRSVKLFMLLNSLAHVQAEHLECLFFKDSIGDVSMKRLVQDLYTANQHTLMLMAASTQAATTTVMPGPAVMGQ